MTTTEKFTSTMTQITERDDSGQFIHARKLGRNITIGLLLIASGVIYMYGGLLYVIYAAGLTACILLLIAAALLIIYRDDMAATKSNNK